jgi:hypothetical protein
MIPSKVNQGDLESLPRLARRRYYMATATIAVLSTVMIADVLQLRSSLLSTKQQKAVGLLLGLLAIYTHISLRADHQYYVKAAQHGCKPAPWYPGDVFGIRYLLETARTLKANVMLQQRRGLLESLGHTYFHGNFPDLCDSITTDDFENVKAVLAIKFEDWNLPAIRLKSFLPVLGKRKRIPSCFVLHYHKLCPRLA